MKELDFEGIDDETSENIIIFLNQASRPEDIAGIEPATGPIFDDPDKGKSNPGYDIGLLVAERILARKESLGGQFENLEQLNDIDGFGQGKLEDFVFSFQSDYLEVLRSFERFLNIFVMLRDEIKWETRSGIRSYSDWTFRQKSGLARAFLIARSDRHHANVRHPPNNVSWNDFLFPVLSEEDAWNLFIAHVAQSLSFSVPNDPTWSFMQYSREKLRILFDSQEMFSYYSIDDDQFGYRIDEYKHGYVLPIEPTLTLQWLNDNNLIADTQIETIERVVDWCGHTLIHMGGIDSRDNFELHWGIRTYPHTYLLMRGFNTRDENGERITTFFTAGCRGTAGFLKSVLRVINIPVEIIITCGRHAIPYFMHIDKYMHHADDIHILHSRTGHNYSSHEILIDQEEFEEFIGRDLDPSDPKCDNLTRKREQLLGQ